MGTGGGKGHFICLVSFPVSFPVSFRVSLHVSLMVSLMVSCHVSCHVSFHFFPLCCAERCLFKLYNIFYCCSIINYLEYRERVVFLDNFRTLWLCSSGCPIQASMCSNLLAKKRQLQFGRLKNERSPKLSSNDI